jgi:hypothetical protein
LTERSSTLNTPNGNSRADDAYPVMLCIIENP